MKWIIEAIYKPDASFKCIEMKNEISILIRRNNDSKPFISKNGRRKSGESLIEISQLNGRNKEEDTSRDHIHITHIIMRGRSALDSLISQVVVRINIFRKGVDGDDQTTVKLMNLNTILQRTITLLFCFLLFFFVTLIRRIGTPEAMNNGLEIGEEEEEIPSPSLHDMRDKRNSLLSMIVRIIREQIRCLGDEGDIIATRLVEKHKDWIYSSGRVDCSIGWSAFSFQFVFLF